MHLVILIKDEKLAKKVENDVSSFTDIGVVCVHSTDDCIGLFGLLDDVAIITFDDYFKASIVNAIKKSGQVVDLLHIGETKFKDPDLNCNSFTKDENITHYLKSNTSHPKKRFDLIDEKELYYPILSSTLQKMILTPVDIFLRVKKEGYFHYIKFIRENSKLDEKEIEKLDSITRVFIKKDDKELFFEKMNEVFVSMLHGKTSNKKVEVDVKEEIFNQLISTGLSERSLKVASATIDNVMLSLEKNLMSEIKQLHKSDAPVNFRKSFMTSILCITICKNLSWVTEDNKSALMLCAFFNDRQLIRDSMHFIVSDYGLEVSDYTAEEKKLFNEHALKTSEWANKQKTMPEEVSRLIKQHHGSASGIGFETSLSTQITKLSMIFMVAEEFAMEILKSKDNKLDVKTALEAINTKYNNSKVRQIIEALFAGLKS